MANVVINRETVMINGFPRPHRRVTLTVAGVEMFSQEASLEPHPFLTIDEVADRIDKHALVLLRSDCAAIFKEVDAAFENEINALEDK